jgi:hypothetical protein
LAEHAGFLSRVSAAEDIRLSWTHVLRMLRDDGAAFAQADDLTTPEAWDRYLAAKEGEAQEGFSEDEFPPSWAEGATPR